MTTIAPLPVRLRAADRKALVEHFLALGTDDRRLRFGASLSDDAVRNLEEHIDLAHDEVFGVADDDLRLIGVVHVAFYPEKAELGLSVLPGHRGKGIGDALFERAVMHLTNRAVGEVFVHCLSENAAMMHLARKHGMRVVQEGRESDAYLVLPRATPMSVVTEWMQSSQADSLHLMRRQTRLTRALIAAFSPDTARR